MFPTIVYGLTPPTYHPATLSHTVCFDVYGLPTYHPRTLSHVRSAGSTLRSRQRPLGRRDSECVRLGNLLCCRALILLCLCASKGVWWILEQPMSSCMEFHPLFQRVIRMLGMRKILISMSNYGGPTEKKTYLYSSSLIVKKHHFIVVRAHGKIGKNGLDWVPLSPIH